MGMFANSNDASNSAQFRALSEQLARLERKVDALMIHLDLNMPEDGLDSVRALKAAGQTIAAIKAYRDLTGAGLAEAKNAVEGLR